LERDPRQSDQHQPDRRHDPQSYLARFQNYEIILE
jgi:hypothetical protein